MSESTRVLLWPRVVRRLRLGADWCAPGRVRGAIDALVESPLRPVDARTLLDPAAGPGTVIVFTSPTDTALRQVFPSLIEDGIPFAVCVPVAEVRTRTPRRVTDETSSVTWSELRDLVDAGVVLGVEGHRGVELDGLPDEIAFGELAAARGELQRRLGVDPWLLCPTGGRCRPEVMRMAQDLGYRVGVLRGRGRGLDIRSAWRSATVPRPWHSTEAILRALEGDRTGTRREAIA